MEKLKSHNHILLFSILVVAVLTISCDGHQTYYKGSSDSKDQVLDETWNEAWEAPATIIVVPSQPVDGQDFRLVAAGPYSILQSTVLIEGPSGRFKTRLNSSGNEMPFWRVETCDGLPEGDYKAVLLEGETTLAAVEFNIAKQPLTLPKGGFWKTLRGWDSATETLYSAWINAIFMGSDEQTSWTSLHEVTQNKERNFLYNALSLQEDDSTAKIKVIMEPDCADNPYFLRAYFAWKLGLPFGYHISDRGYLGKSPSTGKWVTNESVTSKTNPVLAFNSFMRMVMDGVHSGTARASFINENADYYPVELSRHGLQPGTVFADPYGHTFTLVSWIPQTKANAGKLLATDAQPDGTIAIKRFWKGNFLFTTHEVIGEPGFKAFRPIAFENGKLQLLKNTELSSEAGFAPFSMVQQKMDQEAFYSTVEKLINPQPRDAEAQLGDLINALHEQSLVRVKSVANGEAYMQAHPGAVVPMPSSAKGVFQTLGLWEDYSTPNRDLRLLIAMDAVMSFPEKVAANPSDYKLSFSGSGDEIKQKLQQLLEQKANALTITYTRSDGNQQKLSLNDLLKRRDAFEIGYNPNDCAEIRWGAPENSDERASCKRKAPPYQQKNMEKVREWFSKRLHPPT
jgi:hypothetical protein